MIEGVNDSYLDYRKEQGKWASSKVTCGKQNFLKQTSQIWMIGVWVLAMLRLIPLKLLNMCMI